jgi:hypothetical protein
MAGYTLARLAHAASYILIEDERLSFMRSVIWWCGNLACFNMLGQAAKNM